jgi:hypothetical protein
MPIDIDFGTLVRSVPPQSVNRRLKRPCDGLRMMNKGRSRDIQ